jgi:hypothetical protein
MYVKVCIIKLLGVFSIKVVWTHILLINTWVYHLNK